MANEKSGTSHRISHVDIAKGITILLVALAHSDIGEYAVDVVTTMGLFRLPLFFFLSGVFFNEFVDAGAFIGKRIDRLLKPYFFTLIAHLVYSVIFMGADWEIRLFGIFYGNADTIRWVPLWFLPHLFAVHLFGYLFFLLTNVRKRRHVEKCLWILLFLVIGIIFIDFFYQLDITALGFADHLPGLPFTVDVLLVSSAFFISGSFLREKVVSFRPDTFFMLASATGFLLIVFFTDALIDMNMRYYIDPLFATLAAVFGIYFVIGLSAHLDKLPLFRRILLMFGSSSLFILIFHQFIEHKVFSLLLRLNVPELRIVFSVSAYLAGITVPLFIKFLISKNAFLSLFYFPIKTNPLIQKANRMKRMGFGASGIRDTTY